MSFVLGAIFAPGFFTSEPVHIALAIGAVAAIVTGTVGVFTVIRGQSFAGEALGDIGTTGGSAAFLVAVGPLWGFAAVAIAANPSPRPVSPSPSVVVPDTETGAPSRPDKTCCASARRGPILGWLPITCTAALPTR